MHLRTLSRMGLCPLGGESRAALVPVVLLPLRLREDNRQQPARLFRRVFRDRADPRARDERPDKDAESR